MIGEMASTLGGCQSHFQNGNNSFCLNFFNIPKALKRSSKTDILAGHRRATKSLPWQSLTALINCALHNDWLCTNTSLSVFKMGMWLGLHSGVSRCPSVILFSGLQSHQQSFLCYKNHPWPESQPHQLYSLSPKHFYIVHVTDVFPTINVIGSRVRKKVTQLCLLGPNLWSSSQLKHIKYLFH